MARKPRRRLKSRRQRVAEADFVVGMNLWCQGHIEKSRYTSRYSDTGVETLTWDIQFMYMYLVKEKSEYGPQPDPMTLGDFNEEIHRQNKVKRNKFLDYLNGFDKLEYYYGR